MIRKTKRRSSGAALRRAILNHLTAEQGRPVYFEDLQVRTGGDSTSLEFYGALSRLLADGEIVKVGEDAYAIEVERNLGDHMGELFRVLRSLELGGDQAGAAAVRTAISLSGPRAAALEIIRHHRDALPPPHTGERSRLGLSPTDRARKPAERPR